MLAEPERLCQERLRCFAGCQRSLTGVSDCMLQLRSVAIVAAESPPRILQQSRMPNHLKSIVNQLNGSAVH